MYAFDYHRPATLAQAIGLLTADDMATPVSGGQTLIPVLRARLAAPSQLVDLARLPELAGISERGGRLWIGAAETHAAVSQNALVRRMNPALAALAGRIGDVQVRHRGTIGGSLANNDPAACYPTAALALDAEIVTSRRTLPADEFFTGIFATALQPGELITAVSFPDCQAAHYEKFRNPASRFALVAVFAAKLGGQARLAVTGAGAGVFRWTAGEVHLDAGGNPLGLAGVQLDPIMFTGDMHGSADYRSNLTRVVAARAWTAIGR